MTKPYSLIVTDTSPLFTPVLADALDVLLRPGLPIRIRFRRCVIDDRGRGDNRVERRERVIVPGESAPP